jgi:hypothetical protein
VKVLLAYHALTPPRPPVETSPLEAAEASLDRQLVDVPQEIESSHHPAPAPNTATERAPG